jgi:hypothetical protein
MQRVVTPRYRFNRYNTSIYDEVVNIHNLYSSTARLELAVTFLSSTITSEVGVGVVNGKLKTLEILFLR